jgi:hypothetical protein
MGKVSVKGREAAKMGYGGYVKQDFVKPGGRE